MSEDRGCCDNCGEGFDNEDEWKYNTECELCGETIPEHLIIKEVICECEIGKSVTRHESNCPYMNETFGDE